jgi:hypothetical protein
VLFRYSRRSRQNVLNLSGSERYMMVSWCDLIFFGGITIMGVISLFIICYLRRVGRELKLILSGFEMVGADKVFRRVYGVLRGMLNTCGSVMWLI